MLNIFSLALFYNFSSNYKGWNVCNIKDFDGLGFQKLMASWSWDLDRKIF